ncbi:hypothetical protein [Bacillus amyloliquefaciens]|uniref:hypothetical protein n=1 Tax=Bacillus amyloliquefaciens TaxID=1390 RepID=UPI001C68C910|nr:hypothetical protein [Bacillus amyloliquefaciens]MBW8281745.1 hypothetical protein [Bacillus amyloliquefaciens]MEC5260902.1 hypothetical protein [Bacillus amyloliquefaciens]
MHVLFYDKNKKYIGEADIEGKELPPNSTKAHLKPGMFDPEFDEIKGEWIEAATQEYIDQTKSNPEPNPLMEQISAIGKQLSAEELARKQAEEGQQALGVQLTNEILARKQAEAVNISMGKQLAALKLKVLELEGGMSSES